MKKAALYHQYTSPPNGVPRYTGKEWYQTLANQSPSTGVPANNHAIAENIVALVITPRLSQQDELEVKGTSTAEGSPLAPYYLYDSAPRATTDSRYNDGQRNPTNQLPPILQVTMVAIDETSAIRLRFGSSSANIFGVATKFTNSNDYTKDFFANPQRQLGGLCEQQRHPCARPSRREYQRPSPRAVSLLRGQQQTIRALIQNHSTLE